MFYFILPLGCLITLVLSEPQWTGGGYASSPHGAAPLGADGRVVDTPEVQAAKTSHLAALADASARAGTPPNSYSTPNLWNNHGWNGSPPPYAHSAQYGTRYQ